MGQEKLTKVECVGVEGVRACSDCARKHTKVAPSQVFIEPPLSVETGQCSFYRMGENAADKRINIIGSNSNDGKHYPGYNNEN